jgi:hypothetical protein
MISAFRAYQIYLSIQSHFNRDKYNAIKYRFKTNASPEAFLKRRDRHHFVKLANTYTREDMLVEYLVANVVAGNTYVSDMNRQTYLEWSGKKNRLSYQFKLDMQALICYIPEIGFDKVFIENNGQYPIIMKKYIAGEVCLETVTLFHKITGACDRMPDFDPLIWPDLKRKIVKYAMFLKTDTDKLRSVLLDIMKT